MVSKHTVFQITFMSFCLVFVLTAFGADQFRLVTTDGLPGEIVSCTVLASNSTDVLFGQAEILYEREKLQFINLDFTNSRPYAFNAEKMYLRKSFYDDAVSAVFYMDFSYPITRFLPPGEDWEIFTIYFRIRSLADPGATAVTFTDSGNLFYTRQKEVIKPTTENGEIVILESTQSPPPDLLTSIQQFRSVHISWENGLNYDSFKIMKNDEHLADLSGDATSYIDENPDLGTQAYTITGIYNGQETLPATTTIVVGEPVVPPVTNLVCTISVAGSCSLEWENMGHYSSLQIHQGDALVEEVGPETEAYTVLNAPDKATLYQVIAVMDGVLSDSSTCVTNGSSLFRVGNAVAAPGERDVRIPFYITNHLPVSCGQINLAFDSQKLEVEGYSVENALLGETGYDGLHERKQFDHYGLGIQFEALPPKDHILQPHIDECLLYLIVNIKEEVSPGEVLHLKLENKIGDPPLDNNLYLPDNKTRLMCDLIDGEILIENEVVQGVKGLRATKDDSKGTSLVVSWKNGQAYDEIQLERNGEVIAALPGTATSFRDTLLDTGAIYWYKVRGTYNGAVSTSRLVPFTNLSDMETFRRGDVNLDIRIDLADAITILNYMFGQQVIGCHDAADVNDDGAISLADPISLLSFVFADGPEPPAPGTSISWIDPTPDELDCHEPMH